jgi:hypothetical protein
MSYFQLCLWRMRLLTYSRPMKYPAAARAASRTIATRIDSDSGRALCSAIGAAITAIIGEYISDGNRCRLRWSGPERSFATRWSAAQSRGKRARSAGALRRSEAESHPGIGFGLLLLIFRASPGYPGDHPCPAKGAAIQSRNDEDQSPLKRGTPGVCQER